VALIESVNPQWEDLAEERHKSGYSLRPEQLVGARKLKWIHWTAAGVAQLMYPELRESGIVVTNPSGIFSVPMAEHTMGLLLALARNFSDSVRH
jgi:phosphoglycerate dehydrogenase-like enzyme